MCCQAHSTLQSIPITILVTIPCGFASADLEAILLREPLAFREVGEGVPLCVSLHVD
jgi:hypothetical protein